MSFTLLSKIGHSLGGALAQLDSLYFTLNLPSKITISATTYGLPRVGNPAYATYFDSKVRFVSLKMHTKLVLSCN
jgi:predicted lipase